MISNDAIQALAPHEVEVAVRYESPSMAMTMKEDVPIAVGRADGCNIWDVTGKKYLDLTAGSGVLAVGHNHPDVTAAISAQSSIYTHGGWQFTSPARAKLTEQIAGLLPWEDPMLLWCTTGSEAVEAALKIARVATGRQQVLGFLGGYHGKTAGALTVTANSSFRRDVTELPVASLSLPYPVASGYVGSDARSLQGHDFGRAILEHPDFGLSAVAGLIVETVQGAGGMQAGAPGFLTDLRRFTSSHGLLLIVDEIFTGFGRTGSMFGFEAEGVIPDLVVLGKGIGGGLPVSLVAGPREIMERMPPLLQTSTFSANPVACAAGQAVLNVLAGDQIVEQVSAKGERLMAGILKVDVDGVKLRSIGKGLMFGAQIVTAPTQNRGEFVKEVLRCMRNMGVVALRGGHDGSVIKWTPPLNISDSQIDTSVEVFAMALALVAKRYS